jgi:hypothetical protein
LLLFRHYHHALAKIAHGFSICSNFAGRFLDPSCAGLYDALMSQPSKRKHRAALLGVGLDSDGHKRITTGENFTLVGGSQDTHEAMTEKAIKINEKLKARGKQLESVSREEFDDIAHEVGLKKIPAK